MITNALAPSLVDRVRMALAAVADSGRPEVWITLRTEAQAVEAEMEIERRLSAGAHLPLAGWLVAVKDNIDVLGLPTTAGSPEFSYLPQRSATAVERLERAGALVIGKTNLDQFATGLVGTRSPYGAVRHATDPLRISGGSSSGSATAVALGLVDVALGTDTAGSGRVPASFNNLIGLKPTLGLIPNTGVVPASRSFDTVSVLAPNLEAAVIAFKMMAGPDGVDPRARTWPADVALASPPTPRLAIPDASGLVALSAGGRAAFARAVQQVTRFGVQTEEIDIAPLLEAALLLYDGALVAERYQSVGAFLDTEPANADPTVSAIIRRARDLPAWRYAEDLRLLDEAKRSASKILSGFSALLLPTVPRHPTLAEVADDPLGVNRELGTYTNFVNLLDLAAVAIPAGDADGSPFGVTIVSRAFDDQIGFDIAATFLGQTVAPLVIDAGTDVAVFGAHLRGQPLNSQLIELGARFIEPIRTSDSYRLFALDTVPAKPGLVEVRSGEGAPISGEVWRLSRGALGRFLAALPRPMSLGRILLDDGRDVVGFTASAAATAEATDITDYGGWRDYLRAQDPPSNPAV
ncbi:allophanate hydrolase [uncultured Microbacterium sp.]|uniref:allophanate hydrolase n=1 Tax=uncultured Microbacterium sp. TaxID=191216 RepID=UPI0035C9470A